ncbi:MAG: class I SAM-dependent methyltransferase [Proteobacteria bacterium]|nr:class I SAM-dependent methyltransferase [Pseudomonadota bacterium]
MPETHANSRVLAFYRELPFNYRESAKAHAQEIRRINAISAVYPVLTPLLGTGSSLLDVGCGAGWFCLNAAYHHGCVVTGIDFNDIAVNRAQRVAQALGVKATLETADLFLFRPTGQFDIVASMGVLHHTDDCHAAVRWICQEFVKPGGHVVVSLYHRHGRRPLLDHFAQMRADGKTEDDMLEEYRRLHPRPDAVYLRSWFRDQVLHPHETQHTLGELLPILEACGMSVVATTINQFAPFDDISEILALEPALEKLGAERLQGGQYYPGVFVFLARKIG